MAFSSSLGGCERPSVFSVEIGVWFGEDHEWQRITLIYVGLFGTSRGVTSAWAHLCFTIYIYIHYIYYYIYYTRVCVAVKSM